MVTPTPELRARLQDIEYFRPSLINNPKRKLLVLRTLDTAGLTISDIRWFTIEYTKLVHRIWGPVPV